MNVANWEKWQSYRKDRGTPPWIKVHRNLLSNQEWVSLSDSEKGQLVSMWLLAADKKGVIPDNATVLQKMCLLDKAPNISKFIDLGFLSTTCQPHDNQVTTMNDICDAPETETETEKRLCANATKNFDEWYSSYPKKKDKAKAMKAWSKLKVDDSLLSEMLSSLEKQKASIDWTKENGQYIPLPSTYLNGRRWEDEVQTGKGDSGWY